MGRFCRWVYRFLVRIGVFNVQSIPKVKSDKVEKSLNRLEKESVLIQDHAREICLKFNAFHSTHEALGVILEEFEEFKDEIKANNTRNAVKEARQLASAALVFCAEYGDEP